jgi:hypothetical protein
MKNQQTIIVSLLSILLTLSIQPCAGKPTEMTKSYYNMKAIDIETIEGDCVFKSSQGNTISLQVIYEYTPDFFQPEISETGNTLVIREKVTDSCSGYSKWIITAPEDISIQFKSWTGDIEIDGFNGVIHGKTSSGHLEVKNCKGNLQVNNDPSLLNMILRWMLRKLIGN